MFLRLDFTGGIGVVLDIGICLGVDRVIVFLWFEFRELFSDIGGVFRLVGFF